LEKLMGLNAERTAVEWFEDAARWYIEGHQGCVSCGGQHCVFRSEWGARVEYYCSACDFSVCHDRQTGRYFAAAGDGPPERDFLLGGDASECEELDVALAWAHLPFPSVGHQPPSAR
jgi:hypothetical protein